MRGLQLYCGYLHDRGCRGVQVRGSLHSHCWFVDSTGVQDRGSLHSHCRSVDSTGVLGVLLCSRAKRQFLGRLKGFWLKWEADGVALHGGGCRRYHCHLGAC